MKRFSSIPGFTLVEVLVVVVVLGILAAILSPIVGQGVAESRDRRREVDLKQIENALNQYTLKYGVFPIVSSWSGDAPAYGGKGYTGAGGYIPNLAPEFLKVLPRDPNPSYPLGSQGYLYYSNGTDFKVLAHYTPTKFDPSSPFYDPARPTSAYQVSSAGGKNW